ncbi:MAG: hypothetical protein IT260_23320 [Saprospiraceae bacterium]|nr:hypothetical protein [Saprospiraceae bacterium]
MLQTTDRLLQAGEGLAVEFTAAAQPDLAAFQFALSFDPAVLQLEKVEPLAGLPLEMEHFGTQLAAEGELRAAWAQAKGVQVEPASPLFRVYFTALQSGQRLSEVLRLNDTVLAGLSYTTQLEESGVELAFGEATGTHDPAAGLAGFRLLPNRPNPFRAGSATTIEFELPAAAAVQLRVLDVDGREWLRSIRDCPAGRNSAVLQIDGCAAGILYCECITPFGILTRKMVMLR